MPSAFIKRCPDCREKVRLSSLDGSETCQCGTQLALPLKPSKIEGCRGENPLAGLEPAFVNMD